METIFGIILMILSLLISERNMGKNIYIALCPFYFLMLYGVVLSLYDFSPGAIDGLSPRISSCSPVRPHTPTIYDGLIGGAIMGGMVFFLALVSVLEEKGWPWKKKDDE
jgi:hypothetical protein